MTTFKSDWIFELVAKYQISLDIDRPAEFLDETYAAFCGEYLRTAAARDILLKDHLRTHSSLFRTFLPWRQNVIQTIFQLQWYYDELIIFDPVLFHIERHFNDDGEEQKEMLRILLSNLRHFKDSIDFGFLLFCGTDSSDDSTANGTIDFREISGLIDIPEIRDELDKLVYVAKLERYEEEELIDLTIKSFYRNRHGFFPIVKKPGKAPDGAMSLFTIDLVGSNYKPASVEEVRKAGAYSKVYDSLREEYPVEFFEILHYLSIGDELNSPVLLTRKLDELVLANLPLNHPGFPKTGVQSFYELTLPFVDGIPPDRLLELRAKMPNAFLDFRNTMFELINDLQRNEFDEPIFQLKLRQRVHPQIAKLDVEMRNSLLKAKILGVGAPIMSGLGALALWKAGMDPKLLSLLFGGAGVASELKAIADRISDRNIARVNPFYYLWKANKGS